MEKMKYYTIDWLGPFDKDVLFNIEKQNKIDEKYPEWEKSELYIITGKRPGRSPTIVQYIGLTGGKCYKRVRDHFKSNSTEKNREIFWNLQNVQFWIGRFERRNRKNVKAERELLEWGLIHCTNFYQEQDTINERKNIHPPKDNVTILSRFFSGRSGEICKRLGRYDKGLSEFPEVIMWKESTYYISNKLECTPFEE